MTKFQKIIIILFAVIVALTSWYVLDRYQTRVMVHNTKRLVELGVSRERVFWKCLDEKNIIKVNEWKKSESFMIQTQKYDDCARKADDVANSARCKTAGPLDLIFECAGSRLASGCDNPNHWREAFPETYNEQSSRNCSIIADESEEGRLMSAFRKKVPTEALTDNELHYKIMNVVRPY